MEGNLIVSALTDGATSIGTGFVSLVTSLLASPAFIGIVGIGLGYGLLKFALNRLPGAR